MAHTPWCLLPLDIMGPTNSVPLVKETRITNSKDWWFTITPKNYKKKVKKIKRKKKYWRFCLLAQDGSPYGSKGIDMTKKDRLGQVKWVASKKLVILNGLKRVADRVGLARIFFIWFFFKKNKENSMYLPFGKSCNKLLDVKYITLNSSLISRMNSVKFINTYSNSIILKLYKS